MNYDTTLLDYFWHASIVVKCVMLLLISASIVSWMIILQHNRYLKNISKLANQFEELFWSGKDLAALYTIKNHSAKDLLGMEAIFYAGFKEFLRYRKQQSEVNLDQLIANTQRAMRVAEMREQDKLEQQLPLLAIVGSTSPYVGLFGTVWGIMQAFRALANVQQATISMVAPGIAEALIATALGLFAAIPAVIAYNRFVTRSNRLLNRFDAFQEELINILIRQVSSNTTAYTVSNINNVNNANSANPDDYTVPVESYIVEEPLESTSNLNTLNEVLDHQDQY